MRWSSAPQLGLHHVPPDTDCWARRSSKVSPTFWTSGTTLNHGGLVGQGGEVGVPRRCRHSAGKVDVPMATPPYSGTEVPRMECPRWRRWRPGGLGWRWPDEVYVEATNWLMMVEHMGMSLEAFCSSKVTWSGRASLMASMKPLVAASSASCWTSWQMPTV